MTIRVRPLSSRGATLPQGATLVHGADDAIDVTFRPNQQQTSVSLRAVQERIVDFLEHYADIPAGA